MVSETVEVNFGAVLSAKKGDSLLMFPMPPPAEPWAEGAAGVISRGIPSSGAEG